MNDLQKVEFDILKCVVEILDNLHISYYLVCGSALGAAKYHGFIPWDDDIDIALKREDYELFINIAPDYLPKYYFLQNHHTEKMVPFIFSKVRDSRTTFIENSVSDLDINHGVYIDIFPLDEYPKSKISGCLLEIKKFILRHQIASVYAEQRQGLSEIYRRFNVLFGYNKKTNSCVKKLEKVLNKYNGNGGKVLCNHGSWQGKLEYADIKQYGNGCTTSFEGMSVKIPEKYDEYLTQKYGNWRADLPEKQRVGHHYARTVDLQRPYTYYINRSNNVKESK